jgi:hypothetical protein
MDAHTLAKLTGASALRDLTGRFSHLLGLGHTLLESALANLLAVDAVRSYPAQHRREGSGQ